MWFFKKKTVLETTEVSCRVRAVVGIGNNLVQGVGLLCENKDGSAGFLNVWRESDSLKLISFIDEGESRIVWTHQVWSDGTEDWVINHIYLR